ncbi:MAG TPA: hypothetical protein VFM70_12495 [Salinimicrobium sp.]|nr:hypothetical protein [Salinimicrobium sp.]
MKCNNKSIVNKVPLIYFLLIASIFATNVVHYHENNAERSTWWLIATPTLLLLVLLTYFYRNAKYFEFDSSGEVLVVVNRGTFLSRFLLYREEKAEFPKSKLKDYEIRDFVVYKSLNLYIKSDDTRTKKTKFNITFLNRKKQKLILNSLSDITDKNKRKA